MRGPQQETSVHDSYAAEGHIPLARRIFVNRNLKMNSIRMVGFDMDHTVAVYQKLPFETLAYEATRDKLVADKGYPEGVLALRYDPELAIRGLVVDKRLGNLLKIDQYNYVVRAFHGLRLLDKEERKRLYRNRGIRLSSGKYMSIDTLFGLPEAVLFAQLVDYFERVEKAPWKDYTHVYADVRECIDHAHADDTIKREIVAQPDRFLVKDPNLAATLEAFRNHGKKTFLLTNSEPYYTQAVMSFLLDAQLESTHSWQDYFDLIVVSAGKPRFFNKDIAVETLSAEEKRHSAIDDAGKPIYRGGGIRALERLAGIEGDEILYVGDHTFGDILRAKKRSRWRTAMVVEELATEIDLEAALRASYRQLDGLVTRRNQLVFQTARMRRRLRRTLGGRLGEEAAPEQSMKPATDIERQLQRRIVDLDAELREVKTQLRSQNEEIEARFNRNWGKLFKCWEINSHFGHQVKDFACIYTSAVSNFLAYPEGMYFRSPRENMPHELHSTRG